MTTHAEISRALTSRWPEHRVAPSQARIRALTDLLGEARDRILAGPASPAERKARLQEMFHADILDWLRSGRWDRIEHHLNHVLGDDALLRPADSGR